MYSLLLRLPTGFEWLLAWRIVRARKSRFLNVITTVAIVGIAFGVLMLTIVLSVTGGFQDTFRERILGLHPHLLVWPRDDSFTDYRAAIEELELDERVIAATPATYDDMMLAHGDHRAGAVVKGVDVRSVGKVLDVESLLTSGALVPLDEEPRARVDGDQILIDNFVQETSWTLVVWGADQVLMVPDTEGQPLPDECFLSIVHANAALGNIDIAIKESKAARAAGLKPGGISRPVLLPAGTATLELGEQSSGQDPALESGGRYLYILAAHSAGLLITQEKHRPAPGEARVRVVDARPSGARALTATADTTRLHTGPLTGGGTLHDSRMVAARPPGIILGTALAERLSASVGDLIAVSSTSRGLANGGTAPMGMAPTSGRFRVEGVFKSGYFDYDKRFALVGFSAAIRFLGTGDRAKWLEVKVDDVFQIDSRKQAVMDILQPYSLGAFSGDISTSASRVDAVLNGEVSQFVIEEPDSALGLLRNSAQVLTVLRTSMPHTFSRQNEYSVITWQEVNQPLFQALKLQKLVLSIFFLIIIVVAAFNIVGTQIMMVHQKTREIAILKALGANRKSVRRVFLIQGFIVSSLGAFIGLVLGLGSCLLLDWIGYPLEPEVYLIDHLPVTIELAEIGIVCVAALMLTFVATLYSANRAGRLLPVDGIRYIE